MRQRSGRASHALAMDLVYSSMLAVVVCLLANRLFGRLRGVWGIAQFCAALFASVAAGAVIRSPVVIALFAVAAVYGVRAAASR